MTIGNNDEDFLDEVEDFEQSSSVIEDDLSLNLEVNSEINNKDTETNEVENSFITSLLRERGIEDLSKIKFENESGEIEEVDWKNLSDEDKFNILRSNDSETELDDSEILLINSIRQSRMSPSEYIKFIEEGSVNRYIQNSQSQLKSYSVDQYGDDELFVADFMSRMGDVTEEEALDALAKAKENPTLYLKLIGAIRKEYKTIEEENLKQVQFELEREAQEQYEQFASSVADQINGFTELSGYDLNMEQDDMQTLYDFITGTDAAGNNYFMKALADPATLVKTAWFALNGPQMINDITDYFLKEITSVRKESYNKGLADANKLKDDSKVVFKPSLNPHQTYVSDLDE